MVVTFYKGALQTEAVADASVSWAETDFGVTALVAGLDQLIRELNADQIMAVEPVASFDLPGLDREDIEVIIENILRGGYLDMPGVKKKGEAVLFMLVNEAIHRLAEIAKYDYEE